MVKFKSLRKASDRGLESARSRVTIFLSLVFGLWGKNVSGNRYNLSLLLIRFTYIENPLILCHGFKSHSVY